MQVGPVVPALLPTLVTKLADSDSSPLVVQLLLVLAQLVLINPTHLIDCLASQPAPGLPPSAPHSKLHLTTAAAAACAIPPNPGCNTQMLLAPQVMLLVFAALLDQVPIFGWCCYHSCYNCG